MKYLITTIAALVLVGCSGPPPKDIWEAAKQGDVDAVKQFIVAGEDVNTKDNRGSTSLHDRGRTPLHRAASGGHKEVVELLIAEGADVNAKTDAGFTPLCDAAQFGHKEIAELLIATGADVNAKNKHGETPLDYANGVVATLLRHGAKTGYELKALMPRLVQHGQFAFSFVAKKGKVYEVQDSFDLLNWEIIKTYTGTGDSIRFDEERDHDPPQWFYRVRVVE